MSKQNPTPANTRSGRPGVGERLRNYFGLHFHVLPSSLSQLGQARLANTMTAIVIAIALVMPAALLVFLQKVEHLSAAWQQSSQISVFLNTGVSDKAVEQLSDKLRGWPEVESLRYISPQQARDELATQPGMTEMLALFDSNPLPGVLVLSPAAQVMPASLPPLMARIEKEAVVDLVQLDMEWVERLHALVALAERGVGVLGVLLALGVLFVIGNTIRMAILNRRDEIEVMKLVGGSDGFVRRPFLYFGMWFGLFGGLLAWIFLNLILFLMDGPVRELAALYGGNFSLGMVDLKITLLLLICGPILGYVGAWLVAGRHLKAIEPS